MDSFALLKQSIESTRARLLNHPIYHAVDSREKLRLFMETHVFAVWDFMSLVKRLQNDLSCVQVPWTPPPSARAARFINEIVLAEESDLGIDGKPISHFELYLQAMKEVQANVEPIQTFVRQISEHVPLAQAMQASKLSPTQQNFVTATISCAANANTLEVASFFFFGREDLIPEMFSRLLEKWNTHEFPHFTYYLERHIQLDGDTHGPQAEDLLREIAGNGSHAWQRAENAAKRAIQARIELWDSVLPLLKEA